MPQSTTTPTLNVSSPSPKQEENKNTGANNVKRLPKSTSFKDLIKKDSTASEPIQAYELNKTKDENPFSQEDLVRCWNLYAEKLEKQAHLKNTMLNCQPVLKENYQFEVSVHNPVQKDELASCCIELLQVLRTQLKNSNIQILIRIDETNEKKLAYTSTEKYEHLNNINPLLDKLRDEFDLTID